MFHGFNHETFVSLHGIAANNNREWFQAYRDAYDIACMAPLKSWCPRWFRGFRSTRPPSTMS